MNSSASLESTNQPDLILKLCSHFAKNKPGVFLWGGSKWGVEILVSVLSTNLCKIAFSVLSSPAAACNITSDEQYMVIQIKHILASQGRESAEQFELLYSNMCKTVRNCV
jgi:hypothetical protein